MPPRAIFSLWHASMVLPVPATCASVLLYSPTYLAHYGMVASYPFARSLPVLPHSRLPAMPAVAVLLGAPAMAAVTFFACRVASPPIPRAKEKAHALLRGPFNAARRDNGLRVIAAHRGALPRTAVGARYPMQHNISLDRCRAPSTHRALYNACRRITARSIIMPRIRCCRARRAPLLLPDRKGKGREGLGRGSSSSPDPLTLPFIPDHAASQTERQEPGLEEGWSRRGSAGGE